MAERRGGRVRERAKVRFAVVGLGHIAQVAVLPALVHAGRKAELAALVSGDEEKRRELGERYQVPTYDYASLERALQAESIDAVYIALPNHQHCEFTLRSAAARVHVLCEKPMAVTSSECDRMIEAVERAGVKLMIAYRLHFEAANMKAVEIGASGLLGDLRYFDSAFSMQVKDDNIRIEREKGGGPLYDIGIYCIQAARYLLRDDPVQAFAMAERGDDPRFREVDEMVSAVLRFPRNRLAIFTCSFGATDVSSYRLVGTEGDLRVEPAYEYAGALAHHLTLDGRTRKRTFPRRDQFAAELLYFAECIQEDRQPEPSGLEGKVDVQIIEALGRSAERGAAVALPVFPQEEKPGPHLVRRLAPVRKPPLVHAESGSQ
jgi:glucose-fructose oxidoreductase